MSVGIKLIFAGNCQEAVSFYAKAFEQDIPDFLTYAGWKSNDPNYLVSDKMRSRVRSTIMNIAGSSVELCDTPDGYGFICGNNMQLTVTYENPDEARAVFDRLSEAGQVDAVFQQTHDGRYYGLVEDRFQISWAIQACHC